MIPASVPLDDLLCQLRHAEGDRLKMFLERTVRVLTEAEVASLR